MSDFDLLEGLVPISLFNKGRASDIFRRVDEQGKVIVLKNNIPVAVILSLREYGQLRGLYNDKPKDFGTPKHYNRTNFPDRKKFGGRKRKQKKSGENYIRDGKFDNEAFLEQFEEQDIDWED